MGERFDVATIISKAIIEGREVMTAVVNPVKPVLKEIFVREFVRPTVRRVLKVFRR